MIGQTISHYTITAKLGAGGMGEVYLATDSTLNRQVALKFLSDGLSHDPEARARLLREAQAASKLNHPNILTMVVDLMRGTTSSTDGTAQSPGACTSRPRRPAPEYAMRSGRGQSTRAGWAVLI